MKKLFLVALFATFPMAASAGLITFNLAGDSGDGAEGAALDGLSMGAVSKGGITATFITGFDRVFNQTSSNFGINLVGDGCDNSSQIDGNCGTEALIVGLSDLVELVSITLSNYSPSDDAYLNFEAPSNGLFASEDLASSPGTLPIGALVGGANNAFALGFNAGNGFSFDSFTVRTVPEPASFGLLALGLVALRLRKQRR